MDTKPCFHLDLPIGGADGLGRDHIAALKNEAALSGISVRRLTTNILKTHINQLEKQKQVLRGEANDL